MIITFSGIDGSGKSTQAQIVADYLSKKGYQPDVIHLTQWTWVYQIGVRLTKPSSGEKASGELKKAPHWQILMRQGVAFLDVLRFWVMARRLSPKQILICDRYFYDLGLQGVYSGIYSAKFLKRYWKMVPKPRLAFWLDVPSDVAELREGGEHVSSYYSEKRAIYGRFSPPWPVLRIETNEFAQTQNLIIEQIDRVLNERP